MNRLRPPLVLLVPLVIPALLAAERVEGLVRASSNGALWVETGQSPEILFPARAATLAGYPALKSFRPGDGVRAECTGPGPVRHCEFLEPDLPLNLPGEWVATLADLRQDIEGEAGPVKFSLLDVRPIAEFQGGHLPGARPWSPEALPPVPEKEGPIVLYGRSERDPAPHRVLRKLLKGGVDGVRVFREGIEGWDRAGLPLSVNAEGVALLTESEPVIVVDVRDDSERKEGTLPGAYAIPLERMDWRVFSSSLGMPSLVFYGADAQDPRPRQAAEKALQWRVSPGSGADLPVRVLAGGSAAWKAAGRPFSAEPPRSEIVFSDHLPAGAVPLERFREWLSHSPPDRVFVDLRKKGTPPMPGTLHLPMEELPGRLAELPRDKTLTLFCAAGKQAVVAREMLRLLGFRAEYLPVPFP